MKYLCLVFSDESRLHGLPESPEDAECLALAAGIPAARVGCVEVRPVRELEP